MGVTVTFIAILELMKEGLIEIVQAEAYAAIHVRTAAARHLSVVGGRDADAEHEAALAQPAHPDEDAEYEEPEPSAHDDSVTSGASDSHNPEPGQ